MHLPERLLSSFAKTDTEPICWLCLHRRVYFNTSEVFDGRRLQSCPQEPIGASKALLQCSSPKQSLHRTMARPLPRPPHTQLLIHLLTSGFMFSCYFYTQQSSRLCAGVHDAHYHDLTSFPIYVRTWLDHESRQAKSHEMLFWVSSMHSTLSSIGTFY